MLFLRSFLGMRRLSPSERLPLRRRLCLGSLFLGFLFWFAGASLGPPVSAQEALAPSSFLTLFGKGCAVRYTSGSLDRAHHILKRLELLTYYFNLWNDVPTPTAVYVLFREEWERVGFATDYGIPLRSSPTAIFAPAVGDDGTVSLWRQLLATERLPLVPGVPLIGTAEHAASLALADVLLQVEASRGFVQRAHLLGREAWIGEVVAHVSAVTIFFMYERPELPEITTAFAAMGETLGGESAFGGSDFAPGLAAQGGEELRKWLWFQAQFHRGALIIFEKDGKKAIKKLRRLSDKSGGLVPLPALLERYPDLRPWLDSSFASASATSP